MKNCHCGREPHLEMTTIKGQNTWRVVCEGHLATPYFAIVEKAIERWNGRVRE